MFKGNPNRSALEVRLPAIRALAAAPDAFRVDDIPRKHFRDLWGYVAADAPFDLTIEHEARDLGGLGVPTVDKITAVVDPTTAYYIARIEGLGFLGDTFNVLLDNSNGNMTQFDYHLEMRP